MDKRITDFLVKEEKKNIRFCIDKKKRTIILLFKPSFDKSDDCNYIKIYDTKTLKEIGLVKFYLLGKNFCKYVFLDLIEIKDENFLFSGVGSYALKFMEEKANETKACCVNGLFFSKSLIPQEKIEKFYERNGYQITCEKQFEIFKTLIGFKIKNNEFEDQNGYIFYGPLRRFKNDNLFTDGLTK